MNWIIAFLIIWIIAMLLDIYLQLHHSSIDDKLEKWFEKICSKWQRH